MSCYDAAVDAARTSVSGAGAAAGGSVSGRKPAGPDASVTEVCHFYSRFGLLMPSPDGCIQGGWDLRVPCFQFQAIAVLERLFDTVSTSISSTAFLYSELQMAVHNNSRTASAAATAKVAAAAAAGPVAAERAHAVTVSLESTLQEPIVSCIALRLSTVLEV